jgi:hypothetical protein
VSCIDIHPGGDNLIVGSYDSRVNWFDLDLSTKPYKTLKLVIIYFYSLSFFLLFTDVFFIKGIIKVLSGTSTIIKHIQFLQQLLMMAMLQFIMEWFTSNIIFFLN